MRRLSLAISVVLVLASSLLGQKEKSASPKPSSKCSQPIRVEIGDTKPLVTVINQGPDLKVTVTDVAGEIQLQEKTLGGDGKEVSSIDLGTVKSLPESKTGKPDPSRRALFLTINDSDGEYCS